MLKKIVEKFTGLNDCQRRSVSDTYCELVLTNKTKERWDKIFSGIFGEPAKPAGANPTRNDTSLTEGYGGIYDNQVLFKKELKDFILIAMLWPWQDGAHTTLKIAALKKRGQRPFFDM